MKYLKIWKGYDPKKEEIVTRMRIIEGAERLSHEIGTQKDEVFYNLSEENVNNLKAKVTAELRDSEKKKIEMEIEEVESQIKGLIDYKEHLKNKKRAK